MDTTTGISVINNKPTLFSGSYTDLTNKPTIPSAQVNSDWTATTGISVINNKPTLFSGSYTDLTNKPTIPAAQVNSDWTATTGISVINNKPTIPAAPTSANLITLFNTSQFTNNTGTNKIDILSTWKPSGAVLADTTTILANSRNIAGVSFNGSADIAISYNNLTNRPCISPAIFVNFDTVHTTKRVRIGTAAEASALLHLTGNTTVGGTLLLEHISSTPNIELVRGLTSSTTDFNWNILNDNSFKIQNKTSTNVYTDRFTISSVGVVSITGGLNITGGQINSTNILIINNTTE